MQGQALLFSFFDYHQLLHEYVMQLFPSSYTILNTMPSSIWAAAYFHAFSLAIESL